MSGSVLFWNLDDFFLASIFLASVERKVQEKSILVASKMPGPFGNAL